jgi:hypothetical protein
MGRLRLNLFWSLQLTTCDLPVLFMHENTTFFKVGWKCFQNLAKHEKHFLCLVKQAKMKSYHQSPKYKFGYRIPKDYEEALN